MSSRTNVPNASARRTSPATTDDVVYALFEIGDHLRRLVEAQDAIVDELKALRQDPIVDELKALRKAKEEASDDA